MSDSSKEIATRLVDLHPDLRNAPQRDQVITRVARDIDSLEKQKKIDTGKTLEQIPGRGR